MAKRIYTILGAVALVILVYLVINPETFASRTTVWSVTILYAAVVGCIHGILGHSLSAKQKGNLIIYPLAMGGLFAAFAYIFIYVILPLIIPGFM